MTGYSRSPKLTKGALVVLDSSGMAGFVPRSIPFQYNPTSLSRTLTPVERQEDEQTEYTLKAPYDPEEKFSIELVLDASDAMEKPDEHPVESVLGVAPRLAAFEQLLYPTGSTMFGGPDLMSAASGGSQDQPIRRSQVPVVLFSWGTRELLPVRLTSYKANHKRFNPNLDPIHAEVTIGLKMLTPNVFGDEPTKAEKVAIAAYMQTMAHREEIALSSFAEAGEALASKLPI